MLEPGARGEKNWVLGVTALAAFMMALDGQVVTTAFATIRGEFGASIETLQWTVNGYNLTFAVLLLTGAALGDRFGRRAMFAAGIFLFTLASMACALSGSVEALIAARSAQGAGAALVMPLAMAILSGARDSGMALDLLDQSSDRHDRHRLGAGAASREFWAAGRA
jgi:MFS family permease